LGEFSLSTEKALHEGKDRRRPIRRGILAFSSRKRGTEALAGKVSSRLPIFLKSGEGKGVEKKV